MTVRLSDVFVRPVYESYTTLNSPEKTAFWESGVIATNAALSGLAKQGNKTGTVPFWNDLDANAEPNYSNDDPADFAVPLKVGTGTMSYRKSFVNQSYASMDLVAELLTVNPLQHIRNRFGTYWQRQLQRRLIATLNGLYLSNVASNAGDMVTDISALVGPLANFNEAAVLDAEYSMGDAVGGFVAMAVHSSIAKAMALQDLLVEEKNSDGVVIVTRYRGKRVIIDDSMPKSGAGVDTIYLTALFGAGAFGFGGSEGHMFGFGEGAPENPSWIERVEQSGNGGGSESIGERKTWLLHPFGFAWVEGTLVEFSPTNADLATAGHWTRVVARKQTPLAFIRSKASKT